MTTSVHTQPPLPASEGFPAGGSTDSKGMAIPMSFPGGHTPARVPQDVEASSSAPAPSKDAPLTFTFASIRRVEPTPHINTPGLRAKVSFMTSIETPDEETMVRSLHPSLASYEQVSVVEHGPVATPLWLISASSAKNIKSTHVAGREIHVLPKQLIPPVSFQMVPTRYTTIKTIDPRTFLPPEHIKSIRDAFPGSVGAQVLLTGFLLVVFPDKKSLEACWAKGAPDEVGNLRVGYILASFYGTAEIVESGRGVTDTPGGFNPQAALGLRLRLPGGLDAITTVTHAFVRLTDPKMSNIRKRLTDHILAAKEFLKRLRPPPRQAPQAGIIHSERVANSPLGKEVWLGGTETYIGTITVTYDRLSRHRFIPYPYGFQHDLSLVTGPNLPQLTNPPNTPRVTEWGPYEEALQGRPVFVHSHNVGTGHWRTHQGHGVATQVQQSIIHGTQYSWEQRSRDHATALLWRTVRDTDSVARASGSVLCLGEPQHETARALLFQNFQGTLMASDLVNIDETEDYPTFKGGFLLPQEIRDSRIITAEYVHPEDFRTPQRSSNSGVPMQQHGMTV
ncbi:hypothetical protein N7516_002708 [Penicillium verrucosum]|uniref:uncharacterized protein n=1 Tax=Penicillium verrucosum TaxID=60171 RepID=UPI0025454705|nr:uncharacterized protein N7516_002708 [Penicillium verrucosum]KAJ5942540.1 hypothetical protein N7516_002708 [Penicillium verrucosum]